MSTAINYNRIIFSKQDVAMTDLGQAAFIGRITKFITLFSVVGDCGDLNTQCILDVLNDTVEYISYSYSE